MLFQPTNITPSKLGSLGNGAVDLTTDLTVTWQVNGNSAMTAFQIVIYKNDSASTQVYTTGKLTENCPFYGTDYEGDVILFHYTIPVSAISGAGMANGNQYKLIITQWWGSGSSDYVTQTSASVFDGVGEPTLTVNILEGTASSTLKATATYTQAQGSALNWVRWRLALPQETNNYELLKDTGNIFGTAQLQFSYDGLFNGSTYALRCQIETEDGVAADSGWIEFTSTYATETVWGEFTASCLSGKSGVALTLPEIRNIAANTSGTISVSNSYATLSSGASVIWNTINGSQMAFSEPSAFAWRGAVSGANGNILTLKRNASITSVAASENITEIAYCSNAYVAVNSENNVVYSTDRRNWAVVLQTTQQNAEHHVFSTDDCFFETLATNRYLRYSLDGLNWYQSENMRVTTDGVPEGVCKYNGYYAVFTKNKVSISTDRSNWSDILQAGEGESITGIVSPSDSFALTSGIIVLYQSGVVKRGTVNTRSGLWTWTTYLDMSGLGYNFGGIAYGDGLFVVTADSTADEYFSIVFFDGSSYRTYSRPFSGSAVLFGGDSFISDGFMYSSTDGKTWSKNSSVYCIPPCYNGTSFVSAVSAKTVLPSNTLYPSDELLPCGDSESTSYSVFTVLPPLTVSISSSLDSSGNLVLSYKDGGLSATVNTGAAPDNIDCITVLASTVLSVTVFSGGQATTAARNIPFNIQEINQIAIYGAQKCDLVWIPDGQVEQAVINAFATDSAYHPIGEPKLFLADFNYGTGGGSVESGSLGGYSVYRREGTETLLYRVADVYYPNNALIDCYACSQGEYTYYAYGISEGSRTTTVIASNSVSPCLWDWALLSCEKDKNGIYHPEQIFLFGKNLSSGSQSNNSSANILRNFTQYPTIQQAPWNYKSGSLEALIGTVSSDGTYSDTIDTREEILNLATTANTLFLKDRKGDIFRIRIAGSISYSMQDSSVSQATEMTVPWVETGSADDYQIALFTSDALYPSAVAQ